MPGPFYFAWVGGVVDPPYSIVTSGDVWGGTINVRGITWGGTLSTTADASGFAIFNMLKDDGLVPGQTYIISGTGIPSDTEVQFTYSGDLEGDVDADLTDAVGLQVLIENEDGRNLVFVSSTAGLTVGQSYGISGGGIPAGTTFTFDGSELLTISQNCTSTSKNSALTITSLVDRDKVKNVADTSGLVSGQTYNVFGQGIPAGTTTVFDGSDTLPLSQNATTTHQGVVISISKGATFSDGGAFDPDVHLVEDEDIVGVELDQSEGDFPSLLIEVRRLTVGPLGITRKVWCWFSWDTGTEIIPMFHGRLIGAPEHAGRETWNLRFVARPEDFQTQKKALAETLKVAPYWDPVWLAENENDPDTVLTARTQHWHIDRTTLEVTVSDIIEGEDGVIEITEDQCIYDEFDLSYSEVPLRRINVNADVSWTQTAEGDVDLSKPLYDAFASVGSGKGFPIISTFTGDGLKSSWPAPFTTIGGGWTVGEQSTLLDATWAQTGRYPVQYKAPPPASNVTQEKLTTAGTPTITTLGSSGLIGPSAGIFAGVPHQITTLGTPQVPPLTTRLLNDLVTYDVLFDLSQFAFTFVGRYTASRPRNEIVSFSLEADVQSVLIEPGAAEQEQIDLHSDFISSPIDPDGIPIGDLRRNSYFKTDRGEQSFQYLMMYARAILLARARCVSLKFLTDWLSVVGITCRQSIHITDRRIPGGNLLGKVKNYKFRGNDQGEFMAEIELAAAVGNGGTVNVVAGHGTYGDDYFDPGYQQETGGMLEVGPSGTLVYQSFDDFLIGDDDGVDFFNMTPENVVQSVVVLGGAGQQKDVIDGAVKQDHADPVGALSLNPTRVTMQLVPVTGGSFTSEYSVVVSTLAVPKMVDLEAS